MDWFNNTRRITNEEDRYYLTQLLPIFNENEFCTLQFEPETIDRGCKSSIYYSWSDMNEQNVADLIYIRTYARLPKAKVIITKFLKSAITTIREHDSICRKTENERRKHLDTTVIILERALLGY